MENKMKLIVGCVEHGPIHPPMFLTEEEIKKDKGLYNALMVGKLYATLMNNLVSQLEIKD